MHGGPKNRPPMKGQSRLLLEERGRPQTRDSILGLSQQVACGRDGQDLNKDKVPTNVCVGKRVRLHTTPIQPNSVGLYMKTIGIGENMTWDMTPLGQ